MTEYSGKSYGTTFAIIAFLMLGVLFYLYSDRYFARDYNPNQTVSFNDDELHLAVSGDGHYRVSGFINQQPVLFLLDTGASGIALSEELALRLHLPKGSKVQSMTANGSTDGWMTSLSTITIGGVTINNMPATILPNIDNEILLGMSYLRHFDWHHADGELILKPNSK
ncbi:MAG: TIGR02281 family clan AA aspartic protease [Cardiobacteriales bacterium]|nr:MAG: TIGR02281 family clan AA aspartic protease [Cardiobacteriales bacterium]